MNCKGKCQLNVQFKKLVAENSNDKHQQHLLKISGIEQFVFVSNSSEISLNYDKSLSNLKSFKDYLNFYHFNFQNTSIKPPNYFVC